MSPRSVPVLLCLLVASALVSCGGESSPTGAETTDGPASTSTPSASTTSSGAPASTTTPPASTTGSVGAEAVESTTTQSGDLAGAVTARLADELGDAELAERVVADLDDEVLDGLLGADGAASPLLAFTPSTVPPDSLDAVVVFAFGNRVDPDGTVVPGPVNEDLARVTADVVAARPMTVFAQWEVARFLADAGVPGVVSIEPVVADDGTVVYLSTAGVAEAAADLAADAGIDADRVGVLAFADHAVRTQLTARQAGLAADVPAGVVLPSTYDPDSGQPWTRDRHTYVVTDLQGRLLLAG